MFIYFFLIFISSELLDEKTEESKLKKKLIKETKRNKIRGYNFLLKFFHEIVNFVFVKNKNILSKKK